MKSSIRFMMFKVLSRNDTGETNSHQSGISIPKEVAATDIFPYLGIEQLNPRTELDFIDESGVLWKFQYIYYNDVFFGKEKKKAHNEFRLTCVKNYLKKVKAKAGDSVWFGIDSNGSRRIGLVSVETNTNIDNVELNLHSPNLQNIKEDEQYQDDDIPVIDPDVEIKPTVIKLKNGWTQVKFNK